ncbi:oligosaccharide flippase family protein [Vibrio cholerae]|nr:oligosaccharide flippase family protein [Vibrio cholerae]
MKIASARSSFITMFSGTLVAQIIAIAVLPLLTRLYTPEQIGVQNLFITTINILMPLATFSYPMAIVLVKDKQEGINSTILLSTVIVSILSFLLTLVFLDEIQMAFTYWSICLSLSVSICMLLYGIQQINEYTFLKLEEFKVISRIAIENSLYLNVLKVAMGLFGGGYLGLIVSTVIAMLIKILRQSYYLKKKFIRVQYTKDIAEVKKVAREYQSFPKYRCPQSLINTLSISIPVYYIAIYYDADLVGYYTLALTLLTLPVNLIGNNVTSVLYPILVRYKKSKNALVLLRKYCLSLMFVGFFITFVIYTFGDVAIVYFFGKEWSMVYTFALLLSIQSIFQLSNRPIVSAITAFDYQKDMLIFEMGSFFIKFVALLVLINLLELEDVIRIYSILGATLYLIFSIYVYYMIKREVED